jgi:hypothetical protein
MLVNVYKEGIDVIAGTPFVQDIKLMQYIGTRVPYGDPRRTWTIQSFFAPSPQRAIGGVRAKLQDQKGFVTFCNQRDLEILLGLAAPHTFCFWLGQRYAEPGDKSWVGFYVDAWDLVDDLYERELMLRVEHQAILSGTTLVRYIHVEEGVDVEETYMLLRDWDSETGLEPDPRYETVQRRWVRIERIGATWEVL